MAWHSYNSYNSQTPNNNNMKRVALFVVLGVVALFAAATDRLYMEDFTIQAGETVEVSLILQNATQYTAFQTDLYLPEGLSIEKEDGDYAFELTSRKSRDHFIASHDMPDGAIRIMSYSMNVNPFSGNDGALVTFNITACDTFTEDAIIELKKDYVVTEEEMNEFCHALPRYKRPHKIIFADIPRNPTGKIEKPKLREIYGGKGLVEAQNIG